MHDLKKGDKVKFPEEKQRYTVRAVCDRFAILTKPMNAHKTVLYTILDFKKNIRNRDNLIFGHGYETDEDIEDAIEMLKNGEMECSHRNYLNLDIERIDRV